MDKNLKYFMRDFTKDEIVKVAGPESIKDENGNVIELEIRILSQEEIQRINDGYHKRSVATDKRGNPLAYNGEVLWKTEKDSARATRHIIAEALVYPNLKDKELMDYYKCVDITQMPLLVFRRADKYAHVVRVVMTTLGLIDGEKDEEIIDEAKN